MQTANLEILSFACAFLARGDGKIASDTQSGLDVFTPFIQTRNVSLLNRGKRLQKDLAMIHAISVKRIELDPDGNPRADDTGKVIAHRLDVETGIPTNYGDPNAWWCLALLEYSSKEAMEEVLRLNAISNLPLPVVSLSEVQSYALDQQNEPALASLDALAKLPPPRQRGLSSFLQNMPPRFNLDRVALLCAQSGSTTNTNVLWSNGSNSTKAAIAAKATISTQDIV